LFLPFAIKRKITSHNVEARYPRAHGCGAHASSFNFVKGGKKKEKVNFGRIKKPASENKLASELWSEDEGGIGPLASNNSETRVEGEELGF